MIDLRISTQIAYLSREVVVSEINGRASSISPRPWFNPKILRGQFKISGPWLAGQKPHKIFTATSLAVLFTLWLCRAGLL